MSFKGRVSALLAAVLVAASVPPQAVQAAGAARGGGGALGGGRPTVVAVPGLPASSLGGAPGAAIPAGASIPGLPSAGQPGAATQPGVSLSNPAVPADSSAQPGAAPAEPAASVQSEPAAAPNEGRAEIPAAAAPAGSEAAAPIPAEGAAALAQAAASGAPKTQAQAEADGRRTFDGESARAASAAAPVPMVGGGRGFVGSLLHRWAVSKAGKVLPKGLAARWSAPPPLPRPRNAFDPDDFGGPQQVKMSLKQRVGYGVKWGLTLTGINTLFMLAAKPLVDAFPWQLGLPEFWLKAFGRTELLASYGPFEIAKAMTVDPIGFFLMGLPLTTLMEELSFRGLQFGVLFLGFAALRPLSQGLIKVLDALPDLFLKGVLRKAAGLANRLAGSAFPIAAALSAVSFAMAHFATWGINPLTMILHSTAGVVLAAMAYRSRSLSAPFTAHLVFNLVTLSTVLLAGFLPLAIVGAYSIVLAVFSLAFMYWHWRGYRKARATALGVAGKRGLRSALAGTAALLLAAGLLGYGAFGPSISSNAPVAGPSTLQLQAAQDPAQPPVSATPAAAPAAQSATNAPVAVESLPDLIARVKPSVVRIATPRGMGSGFVVTAEGLVVSNAHVVDAAMQGTNGVVMVQFPDGTSGPAKVVGFNRGKDIALIQLPPNPRGWPALKIGDSSKLREGDEVVAMGHPLGLAFSATTGIVSGLGGGRGNIFVSHLQTDAAINPGNSGGPLINRAGELVGVNTQIASMGGGSIGLGFAITSDEVAAALAQYAAFGNIDTAYLGIITPQSELQGAGMGLLVEQVRPGSPAAKAGIRPGDVILGAGGSLFSAGQEGSLQALRHIMAKAVPGQPLPLAIAREDQLGVAVVTLGRKQ